jgi:hypothetical protein
VIEHTAATIRWIAESMSKPKNTQLRLFCSGLLFFLLTVEAYAAETRPASIAEIQALFDLATVGPQHLRVVADIKTSGLPWTQEQISQELKDQDEMMQKGLGSKMNGTLQRDASNAIARSHSGLRIQHIEEWYSGSHYRLDQTDEGLYSPEYLDANPDKYRNSYVNVDDMAMSPYRSFYVDHELRDVQLSKIKLYGRNNLWRVLGLDEEVALPVLIALLDPSSGPKGRIPTDLDLSTLKMSQSNAKRIHDGADPNWRMEALDEIPGEKFTRLILRGKFFTPDNPTQASDVEVTCGISYRSQRTVCIEAAVTNHTVHSAFVSARGDFDGRDIPRSWKRSIFKPGFAITNVEVVFKEFDLSTPFDDKQVFLPVFPTNYIVSDLTTGKPVVLQNPLAQVKPNASSTSFKRGMVLCVFALTSLIGAFALGRLTTQRGVTSAGKSHNDKSNV